MLLTGTYASRGVMTEKNTPLNISREEIGIAYYHKKQHYQYVW